MTIAHSPSPHRSILPIRLSALVLPLFAATIFLSAWLLFTLEPLFTKMALPLLGGAPSVWSVAMVFFQTMMLAGYAYAHGLMRTLPPRLGLLVHACVLGLAGAFLPITLRLADAPPAAGDPTWWLVRCLAASIGLPFFALAAQGPLLQAWFARSGHGKACDPYFLYAASNIGSFGALLAYPFLVEPLVGLRAQSSALAWLFALCGLLVVAAGAVSLSNPPQARAAMPDEAVAPARRGRPLAWIAWSFIPAALLVSVTAHISTDIAAAPLLWVIPLGLYLLSFVLTFRTQPLVGDATLRMLAPIGGAMALILLGLPSGILLLGITIHLGAFLCLSLVCGRALYETRPEAQHLTGFYAVLSLGGALGGLFAGLVAPQIFNSIVEYPLLVFGALCVRPGAFAGLRAARRREVLAFALIMVSCLAIGQAVMLTSGHSIVAARIAFGGIGIIMLIKWREAWAVLLGAGLLVLQLVLLPPLGEQGESHRSFFGVSRIVESHSGEFRALVHGSTLHGAMRIRHPDGTPVTGRPVPTTYYHRLGPLASALRASRQLQGGLPRISVIGLGAGAMACHVAPQEAVTFYEIDPLVVRLATDPTRFRFLSDCAPQAKIVLGDARLTLAHQAARSNFILVDAFSSDAIPVHLLTLESLRLFLSKLAPHGMILFHTSNNHMDFSAILGRLALELGLSAYEDRDLAVTEGLEDMRTPATAVALVRTPQDAATLGAAWKPIEVSPHAVLWTDDFSSILYPLLARWRR